MRYLPPGSLISAGSVKGVERWKAIRTPPAFNISRGHIELRVGCTQIFGSKVVDEMSLLETACALLEANKQKALCRLWGEFRPCTLKVSTFREAMMGGGLGANGRKGDQTGSPPPPPGEGKERGPMG